MFTWIPFYEELANKLLEYKDNRHELLAKMEEAYSHVKLKYPYVLKGKKLTDIDPIGIFGCFNRGTTQENRIAILNELKKVFDLKSTVPEDFKGIPVFNNLNIWLNDASDECDIYWHLYEVALKYADHNDQQLKEELIECFDQAMALKYGKWRITIGLFWARPYKYINLDGTNRDLLKDETVVGNDIFQLFKTMIKKYPTGIDYINACEKITDILANGNLPFKNIPELSYHAWKIKDNMNEESVNNTEWWPSLNEYDPGFDVEDWVNILNDPEITDKDIMTILTRLKDYGGQATCSELTEKYGESANFYNKKSSAYAKRIAEHTNCPVTTINNDNSKWWPILYTGKYADKHQKGTYIWKLRDELSKALDIVLNKQTVKEYTKQQFLNEVFITEKKLDTLLHLLERKKNIILQGAPGVGKTFCAKRLAYAKMGVKDDSHIKVVQFHQNYSYEDFVLGYRPKDDGFVLEEGVFYEFCKLAGSHKDEEFFFIIDEINRGNLSKIFGELLQLIENDYRGHSTVLAYNKKEFSVPENLYIIGMMNTADRSLALIDYALRRRFAFVDMEPGFDSDGFKNYQKGINNDKFDKLISRIKKLNIDIKNDDSLGKGFCIGHSYFITKQTIDDQWIEEVIEYDILPTLNEYYFDNKEQLDSWSEKLKEVINE